MKCIIVCCALAYVAAGSILSTIVNEPHAEEFLKFLGKFEKEYIKDEAELTTRFRVFQANMEQAKALQALELGTATYGASPFADLTPGEFRDKYLSRPWPKEHTVTMRAADLTGLPKAAASVDWRTKGAVTPVKDQGQCGSCWSFSTTGNVEGQWFLKKGSLISLSEQELVDCDKVDQGCEGGLPSQAYVQIQKLGGLVPEADYKYTAADGTCHLNTKQIAVYINGSVSLPTDEGQLATWCSANGPISIGINANNMQLYTSGIAHPKSGCSAKQLDHGVLIVGYGTSGKTPYWIVKNSWGVSWGEQGYYRVYRGGGICGLNQMCTSAVVK